MQLSDLVDTLSKLNWSRAFALLLTTIIALGALATYETYTHSLRLDRAERALSLAAKAEAFRAALPPKPSAAQLQIYDASLLAARDALTTPDPSLGVTSQQLKFLAALLPWALMALVYLSSRDADRYIGLFGATLIGLLVAALLSFVPNWQWPFGSLLILPALAWVAVVLLFGFFGRRRRSGT